MEKAFLKGYLYSSVTENTGGAKNTETEDEFAVGF